MRGRRSGWLGMAAVFAACSSLPPQQENSRTAQPMSDEDASRVYVDKGVQYMNAGQYQVALNDLRKAVDLDDGNSEAHNALGVLYQRLDDHAESDAHFRKALSLNNDNYAAHNNYGRFLCGAGRADEAFEQFRMVSGVKLYGQPWLPLTNAGLCAHAIGQKAEAERYVRQALEAQPHFPPALLEMARLSRETGQPMAARGFLQRYGKVAGPTPESLALGVEIETALGNAQGASEQLQTLYNRFPDSTAVTSARQRLGQ